MGAIMSNLARDIWAVISRELRNFCETYNAVMEERNVQPNPRNQFNDGPESPDIDRWADVRISYHKDETEFLMYFSVFNDREQQIMTGVAHLDTTISPDLHAVLRMINPTSGQSHGVAFNYPIDVEILDNLFP